MANKVFISFRFSDGVIYKNQLEEKFKDLDYVINKSEDEDRSDKSEETIKKYLYDKLRDTSITIVLLTPKAIEYKRKNTRIDDWLYDELRFSLEDRMGNRTNGIIALYTEDAKQSVILRETQDVTTINDFNNLVRKNMLNIKSEYKYCETENRWNSMRDSYISLVSFDSFFKNPKMYIESALEKRERIQQFTLKKKMD